MNNCWYWRSLSLNHRTGMEVFAQLGFAQQAISTLLESPYPPSVQQPQLCRYSLCAGSPRYFQGKLQYWTPPLGQILPFLKQLLRQPHTHNPEVNHLPFIGGWLGWLGYDLAWEIENLPLIKIDSLPFPIAYWYEPANFAVLDHQEQKLWLATSDRYTLDILSDRLENPPPIPSPLPENKHTQDNPLKFLSCQADYQAAVKKAKEYIQAGDIFQANLSLRFHTSTNTDSWQIYRRLQHINPSPFASYWRTPWGSMISCSPERLVKLDHQQAETRPIAGTRPRGATPELDQQLANELLSNTKERAEHIMLVDLERNDLGRVCQWGSVKVDELLTIERYSHVMHLVSNVTGKLAPQYDGIDLIKALFPGGTITGCPKVRCLEIIEELEPMRRNLFYGSCGYLDLRGNLDLNILIRTLLVCQSHNQDNLVWGQVGAGIVADSDPEKEWHESLKKAEAQLAALKAIRAC